jgi:hypothetical protein
MRRKVVISLIIGAGIIIASIWYLPNHIWTSVSMDGASGRGFGAGRRGIGYESTTWESVAGVKVEEIVFTYSTAEEARKDFEEELKGEGSIVERNKLAEDQVCIVKVYGNSQSGEGAAKIIRLQGTEIRQIYAGALKYALTFEKAWLRL